LKPRGEAARGEAALVVGLALWVLAGVLGPMPRGDSAASGVCLFPVALGSAARSPLEVGCGESRAGELPSLGARGLLFGLPLDVNVAGAGALESLPGIGPARAGAIVEARCVQSFHGLDTLARISGIGARTVAGLEGWAVARASPDCGGQGGPGPGRRLDPREGRG